MPILDLQLRQRELGRIRIGRKAAGKGNPQKLDKFRFTSASRESIEHIAAPRTRVASTRERRISS